ncbi:MAG: hypothetical protein WD696_16865 [Bryobacteraceae bacterium]
MRFAIIAFAASVAFGQTSRVFPLTQNENSQALQEIATVLRVTADIQQVSIDNIKRTLAVEGTPEKIAMAEWLVHQMDLPTNGNFSGVHEYRPAAGSDDVLRVFYLTHASTPQERQEIATTIRSVADVQRMFICSALGALAVRGTNQQIALAAWLTDQLNRAENVAAPAPNEYRLPGDDVARVFELTHPQTSQELQEMVTLMRTIGDIQKIFVSHARRAVVVRATGERVALAAWLAGELDKPVNGQAATRDTAPHEYWLSSSPDNMVRVFYLAGSRTPQDRQQVASQVRKAAGIQRLFVYSPLGALAVRGTAGKMAIAERVIDEMKAQ